MGKNPLYNFLMKNWPVFSGVLLIFQVEDALRVTHLRWKTDHYLIVHKHKKPLPCFAFVNKHNMLNPVTFAEVWKRL